MKKNNRDYINLGLTGSLIATTGLEIIPIAVGVPVNTLKEVLFPITLGTVVSIMTGSVIAEKLRSKKNTNEEEFEEEISIKTLKEIMLLDDDNVLNRRFHKDNDGAEIKPFYYDFNKLDEKQK